jgi:Outer membrane protein beta-barrel domain
MSRVVAIMSVTAILAAVPAFAQEAAPGPGTVEITLIPGGATFFTSKDAGPEFRNYMYGGAVALNFNRYVGIEGEAGGTVGIAQDLTFRGSTANLKPPNMLTYNGNVVLNVAAGHSVVPFVTGGVGGLTMFERTELSIDDTQTLRQRRRRCEMVRTQRPLGTACRLPFHRRAIQGRRSGLFWSGHEVRASCLRSGRHQRGAITVDRWSVSASSNARSRSSQAATNTNCGWHRDEPFMSQKTVQLFIGRVLTDEDLRQQFLEDPRGMLTTFRDQGFELTSGEIESLIQTEKALWTEAAERLHPRLQRCSFHRK